MKLSKLVLFLFITVTEASIPDPVKNEIDLRVEHQLNPSIVVAYYEQGESHFYTQGWQDKDSKQVATINSVYEIGSISKTFTSLLLATLVTDNKLKLDDPVEQYWPQPFKLRDTEDQPITFKHLSTHTSGLPRLPSNLSLFSDDPYANYDRAKLLTALASTKIKKTGTNYAYSNFAVGFLGETLAEIEQSTFNQLIKTKILNPLHLNHTYMTLDQVPESLLVQGYRGPNKAAAWNFKALAGAGSIRSTIQDLLQYGIAYLQQPKELANALQLTMQTHFNNEHVALGLGWHINQGIFWHNGGTMGFRSIIMIDPKNNKVAAGITNHNEHHVEDIIAHLIDPDKPMKKYDFPKQISSEQLTQYLGNFEHPESKNKIRITKLNDQLIFSTKKQMQQKLTYLGEDTFQLKLIKTKIKFNFDQQGQVISLSLMGWGEPQIYQKKKVTDGD